MRILSGSIRCGLSATFGGDHFLDILCCAGLTFETERQFLADGQFRRIDRVSPAVAELVLFGLALVSASVRTK